MNHRVTVPHHDVKTRAVCCCGWQSPWVTAGPPQDDVPLRQRIHQRAVKAGEWHIGQVSR
jgi:hypothetical protein